MAEMEDRVPSLVCECSRYLRGFCQLPGYPYRGYQYFAYNAFKFCCALLQIFASGNGEEQDLIFRSTWVFLHKMFRPGTGRIYDYQLVCIGFDGLRGERRLMRHSLHTASWFL